MNELPSLVTDLALILMLAGLTTLLCKKLKQPLVLGYILAGFLCGPVVDFLPTIADQENIKLWSEIGVIFLMFAVGLEFSIHKLVKVGLPGILASLHWFGPGFRLVDDEQRFPRRYAGHFLHNDCY